MTNKEAAKRRRAAKAAAQHAAKQQHVVTLLARREAAKPCMTTVAGAAAHAAHRAANPGRATVTVPADQWFGDRKTYANPIRVVSTDKANAWLATVMRRGA